MKLTSVEIHPADSSNACILSFRDPTRKNPYNVKALVGLDAEDIVPRFYGVPGSSDLLYYTLSMEKRTVVARIELNPKFEVNESYSDLRDNLYRVIASSRTGVVELQFKNESTVVATISGFIRKFEAPHSTKEPEVQISIECSNPWLKAPTLTNVNVAGFDPGGTTVIDDVSTAPHGFQFKMSFSGSMASFVMKDPSHVGWEFEITPAGGFVAGDVLWFSSEVGNRYIYIVRGSEIIQLADALAPSSVWPILFPGNNEFLVEESDYVSWESISYYATYWGV